MKMRAAWIGFILMPFTLVGIYCLDQAPTPTPTATTTPPLQTEANKYRPYENFFLQRSWPDQQFDWKAYTKVISQTDAQRPKGTPHFQAKTNHENWVVQGPANIGGRINTLAAHPTDTNTIYAGCSQGGVFKTTDGGTTWTPIFDDQPFQAIGHIVVHPTYPNMIFVATGDPNISGHPAIGDGLYKSADGGQTWQHLGLTDQRIVSKVAVSPNDTNLIYAACMGIPFERNNDRGLYKTTDGGQNWTKVLFLSNEAGINDLVVTDWSNPEEIYAAGWDRIRNNHESYITGPSSKVFRSADGGATWDTLKQNGWPSGTNSRVGLTLDGQGRVLAQVIDSAFETKALLRYDQPSDTWTDLMGFNFPFGILGGFGWYFAQIRVNPWNADEIYVCGVDLHRTLDGGATWELASPEWWSYEVHADKHDLIFLDPNSILLATDGGIYKTTDGGDTWEDFENIPNTQFYHIAINPHKAGVYYGGAQDNGTTGGNAQNINAWPRIYGGDGFQPTFHPTDSNIMYAETQNGGLAVSFDGGNSFSSATSGISGSDRVNWDMPYIMSSHNPNVLYTGTYRVYKSSNGANPNWSSISDDLTDGVIFEPRFHTITTLAESPLDQNVLVVGTTDGNVWVTTDGGVQWDSVHQNGLPVRYVTKVACSQVDPKVIYATHSGYRDNDFIPHLHISFDLGQNWQDLSGNLPQLAINALALTPYNDSLIFVATDGGVYVTEDQGANWERLGLNMPMVNVYDVRFDSRDNQVVAGTFSRSIMTISVDSMVQRATAQLFISANDTTCEGNAVALNAGGGIGFNWSPSNGLSCANCPNPIATPDSTTTYTVDIGNGQSSFGSLDVTVHVYPKPIQPVVMQEEDTLRTSNLPSLQWYRNGQPIGGATDTFLVITDPGQYFVSSTDSNGCSSQSENRSYIPTGIHHPIVFNTAVFPNPVVNELTLQLPPGFGPTNLELFDLQGKQVWQYQLPEANDLTTFPVTWPKGVYLLKVTARYQTSYHKLLKL